MSNCSGYLVTKSVANDATFINRNIREGDSKDILDEHFINLFGPRIIAEVFFLYNQNKQITFWLRKQSTNWRPKMSCQEWRKWKYIFCFISLLNTMCTILQLNPIPVGWVSYWYCLPFSLYLRHGFRSESEQPYRNRVKTVSKIAPPSYSTSSIINHRLKKSCSDRVNLS